MVVSEERIDPHAAIAQIYPHRYIDRHHRRYYFCDRRLLCMGVAMVGVFSATHDPLLYFSRHREEIGINFRRMMNALR